MVSKQTAVWLIYSAIFLTVFISNLNDYHDKKAPFESEQVAHLGREIDGVENREEVNGHEKEKEERMWYDRSKLEEVRAEILGSGTEPKDGGMEDGDVTESSKSVYSSPQE